MSHFDRNLVFYAFLFGYLLGGGLMLLIWKASER